MSPHLLLTASVFTALNTANPYEKPWLTTQLVTSWRADRSVELDDAPPPARPARPATPALLPPRDAPRRRCYHHYERRGWACSGWQTLV